MSQKLLNETELILIETAMKSGDEYSDEDRAFNRLLSDVRRLREAIGKLELVWDDVEDELFCQFCNQHSTDEDPDTISHADNCIYLEVTGGRNG